MSLYRRDLLKLLSASAFVGSSGALKGRAEHAAPFEGAVPMNSRHLLTVKLTVQVHSLGARSVFPITGGSFEGARLRGKVLAGGGDWTLLRPDGVLELDLRATLATDDGALIFMTFTGLRHGPAEVLAALSRGEAVDPARYYLRTAPRFETASGKYGFLNSLLAIGSGENRPGEAVHTIEEIL
jgi:hypothetical protein